MKSSVYLLLNLGTIFAGIIIIKVCKIKFSIRAFSRSLLLVSLPFIIWDSWAVANNHWSFNEEFSTGIYISNLAIEEILFFIAVPFVMTVIYQALNKFIKPAIFKGTRPLMAILFILGVLLTLSSDQFSYTQICSLVFVGVIGLLVADNQLIKQRNFWFFQLILLCLFLVFNSLLTALPVIQYSPNEIISFRVGAIPIEDFFYNFALINSFLYAYLIGGLKSIIK